MRPDWRDEPLRPCLMLRKPVRAVSKHGGQERWRPSFGTRHLALLNEEVAPTRTKNLSLLGALRSTFCLEPRARAWSKCHEVGAGRAPWVVNM